MTQPNFLPDEFDESVIHCFSEKPYSIMSFKNLFNQLIRKACLHSY